AARMLRAEVRKNSITAVSSQSGAFDTSTTTWAPASASASPWPVMTSTPVLGDAATASWPSARSFSMSFEPIRPVPPITTIFIAVPFCPRWGHYAASLRPGGARVCRSPQGGSPGRVPSRGSLPAATDGPGGPTRDCDRGDSHRASATVVPPATEGTHHDDVSGGETAGGGGAAACSCCASAGSAGSLGRRVRADRLVLVRGGGGHRDPAAAPVPPFDDRPGVSRLLPPAR